MGNAQNFQEMGVVNNSPGDWKVVGKGFACDIVQSALLGVTAEEYSLPPDGKTVEIGNIRIYQFRRVQTSHLVKVFNVEIVSGNEGEIIVRSELIPHRLADINNLTPDEALYVALYSLIGYRYIYQLCQRRLFSVSDSMIGFTPDGHVKVWINPNFSVNELDVATFKANPIKSETQIVSQILSIVASHCEGGRMPERFLEHYNVKPQRTLTDVLRCFKAFLQSENVAIASAVNLAGKVTTDSFKSHGYYEKVPLIGTQTETFGGGIQTTEQLLGKLYTSNVEGVGSIPQIPRTTFQQQVNSAQAQISVRQNPPGILKTSQLASSQHVNQMHPVNTMLDPRFVQSGFNVPHGRGMVGMPQQMYTRQGTNNFPVPSKAAQNVHLQKPRAIDPRFNVSQPQRPQQRYNPISQAQLAPSVGVATKVLNRQRFDVVKIQEGKVGEIELTSQAQINEAMSPNNPYLNPEANRTANYIGLNNFESIQRQRTVTNQDFTSGEEKSLSHVNPDIRKLMMFRKPEEVRNPNTQNSFGNIRMAEPLLLARQQAVFDNYRNNVSPAGVRQSNVSSISYNSNLSRHSNKSFKADKLVLINGKPVRSNPVEVTEMQSEVGPASRTQFTVYHEMSSFGLSPTIKQQPITYGTPIQPTFNTPYSPYAASMQTNSFSGPEYRPGLSYS